MQRLPDPQMRKYDRSIRPLLFRCDPELAHDAAIRAGEVVGGIRPLQKALGRIYRFEDERLRTEVAGIAFANPIGLAAGYDKNGRAVRAMEALGFGFVEVGSVSADPSAGNPRPRLWRLPDDRAICVHYGLPNEGAEVVADRLERTPRGVPLGVNLVATNRGPGTPSDPIEAVIDDYARSARRLQDRADYLVLNLSCPNTESGRDLFADAGVVRRLLEGLGAVGVRRPVFLKVAPGGGDAAIDRLLEAVEGVPFVSGFCFNLPPGLPDGLRTPAKGLAGMRGAVAGRPASALIVDRVRALDRRMDRSRYRIIGAGGIASAEDAYAMIRAGASLVQVFTALIYEGPGLTARINRGLADLLARDGFARVSDAVGADHRG